MNFFFTLNTSQVCINIILPISSSSSSSSSSESSAQGQVFRYKHRYQGWSSTQRQVLNSTLGKQDCSFTRWWTGAAASRCFPHPTLPLASEQTLKDLKRSQGHQRGGQESGFGWLGPPDVTEMHHRGLISVPSRFWPDQRSWNPNHASHPLTNIINIIPIF